MCGGKGSVATVENEFNSNLDCERRRPRPGRRIEGRFEHDRPRAVGRPNREVRNKDTLPGSRPVDRPVTRSEARHVGAD
jgi:hypothetical protein